MFKKIFLLSLSTTWCCTVYAIHIRDTRLYLADYGGWHALPIKKEVHNAVRKQINAERSKQNLLPIRKPPNEDHDEQNLTDNLNGFVEGGFSWPLSQKSQLHLTYVHFLWDQQETLGNMLNENSQYKLFKTYQTGIWDLTVHYTALTLRPNCKVYVKTGVWALHIHLNEEFGPYRDGSNKTFISKLFLTKHDKSPDTKANNPDHKIDHIGYGGLIGIGVNWLFLPGTYSSLSADLSISAYIPAPSIDWIEPNVVAHIFPFIKGGVRWHIR